MNVYSPACLAPMRGNRLMLVSVSVVCVNVGWGESVGRLEGLEDSDGEVGEVHIL